MEMNEILERLPKHLMNLVIDQPYNDYTAQDHALWRYVMRQNVNYLPKVAHSSYLEGLRRTGISLESIPHMYGMNRILREIGWAAVAVDGFIPPSAFMEFQAYNVLVIAADIRPIDQIGYTPAPDIIHEAAGHAPIIADPAYSAYLKRFGEIGSKAIASAADNRMYEAVRHLSILKADPYTDPGEIRKASERLALAEKDIKEPSELGRIRNLHWWTVEYGLIGTIMEPRIYGAGLLSSIAESYYCMQPKVKKLPYSIEAAEYSFDITEPQPQLFVTPDFETLTRVLEEFADTMALRKGGIAGIRKAIASETTATAVYNSGLQVSGTFSEIIEKNGQPVYIRTTGPTSLCFMDKELPGQGKKYHSEGFGSPVGMIKNLSVPPSEATDDILMTAGISEQHECRIEFESGVVVKGFLKEKIRKDNKLLLLKLNNCIVKYQDRVLFEPSWGMYDMAVGSEITSVYSGPADPEAYELNYPVPEEKTHKIVHSENAERLFSLYQIIRDVRENGRNSHDIESVWNTVRENFPEDWLLSLEITELAKEQGNIALSDKVRSYLLEKSEESENLKKLISDGLALLEKVAYSTAS